MTETPNSSPKSILRVRIAHFVDAQGDQPVGVRAVEPPPDTRQALRGNLYAIVELTGDAAPDNELSERMLSAIQRTYYTAKGSQAEVMRQAVASARQKVDEYNELHADQPFTAGIICVALLQSHLLMLHSGPALALIAAGPTVDRYPADILNFDAPDADAAPEFYRQEIANGAALFLGGAEWLNEVPIRTLAATVAYITIANCGEAARGLRDQYQLSELPGILVVIEPEGGPVARNRAGATTGTTAPPPGTPPPSGSGSAPSSARPTAPGGLPTAVNATPPVRSVPPPAQSALTVQAASPAYRPGQQAVHSSAADGLADASATGAHAGVAMTDVTAAETAGTRAGDPMTEYPSSAVIADDGHAASSGPKPGSTAALTGLAAALAAGAQSGANKTRAFFTNFLPDRTRQDTSGAYVPALETDAAEPALAATSASSPAAPSHFEQALSEAQQQRFDTPEPAQGGRARLFILLALLILLLIPVVVAAVSWGQGGATRAEAESLVELATAQLAAAQDALNAGDGATGRTQLQSAIDNLNSAELLIGSTPQIDAVRAEIERDLQDVLQIKPLNALVTPLIRFPTDALPTRMLNVDQDIYVLDTGRQLIERYRLDPSQEFVPDTTPQVVLRAGDVIDGMTVGRLVDMAWQPTVPGVQDKPGLLVLDRNNHFFRYDPRVEGASFIELGDPAALQIPNQIENYLGRTYVADEGTQQIVRYEPGGFGLTPASWFAEQTAGNLTGLRRMAIDGDIWLLYPTGIVLRYNQGESVPFSVKGSVAQIGDPIDMAVGQQSDVLYIADAANDRIFAFDKNGNYIAQYVAPEADQLANLRGLFLDDIAGRLYILTQSSLFQIPPPN